MNTQELPKVVSRSDLADDGILLTLHISADIVYFVGHFEEHPVLPGVTQLHWAEYFARQTIPALPAQNFFTRMEVIKFQELIRPEQTVSLELRYNPTSGKLHFRFFSEDSQFSSGRLVFTDNALAAET